MQRIQQGTFKPLKVNILISMRWVVSAMFNEPISCPSMAVVAPSYHKTTFEYYYYTQHTLVFPVLWCNYQYPLFPEFGQRVCPTVCDFTFQSTQTLALTQRAGQNLQIYLPLMHLHSIPSMHRHFYKTSSSTLSLKAAPLTVPLGSSWTQQAFHTILALCVSGHVSLRLRSACWSGHILALGLGDSKCHINAPLANVSNPGIRKARVLHQSWGEMSQCGVHTETMRDNALNVSLLWGQHHHPSNPSSCQRGFGWPLALKNLKCCS